MTSAVTRRVPTTRRFSLQCSTEAGFDAELVVHADDAAHDERLRADTELALGRTGPDVGTPILTFRPGTDREGSFFGPVISKAPKGAEAVELWDAVEKLATSGVAELKRSNRAATRLHLTPHLHSVSDTRCTASVAGRETEPSHWCREPGRFAGWHDVNSGGPKYPRSARVGETLREIIAEDLVRFDDERLEFVTVTGIDVDPELNRAIVFFDSLAGEEGDEEIIEALGEYRVRLQSSIARQIKAKKTPILEFRPDIAIRSSERIDEILRADRERRS